MIVKQRFGKHRDSPAQERRAAKSIFVNLPVAAFYEAIGMVKLEDLP